MKYLLVDDDIRVYNLIDAYLTPEETIIYKEDFSEVLDIIAMQNIDLIIIDINLKNENGLEYFSKNRKFFKEHDVEVFFLSQDDSLKSKIEAFQFGAGDYIVKPFEPLELMARIRSKIHKKKNHEGIFCKGDLHFDLDSMRLSIIEENNYKAIELSSTEFSLILYMARREGHLLSRESLLENVWGRDLEVTDRTVDQHISKLKKKLKSNSYYIKTMFKQGYTLMSYDSSDKK